MIKAAVVLDNWKLNVFKKHLDEAGFKYTEHSGLTVNTSVLKVMTESATVLKPTIEAAQKECAKLKGAG